MNIFLTELKKIRCRHIGLLYAATLFLIFIWMVWAMSDMDDVIIQQGYYYMLLSIPLMNGVFLPTIVACVESRLCDIEIKGNTYKLLCTMQQRHSIYHIKLLFGILYLLFFSLAETAVIPLLGKLYHVEQEMPVDSVFIFLFSTFTVSTVLILIQQPLSLLCENQLFPLFFGVGGTFVGIFSWFFPQLPIRYMLPWGYYCVGTDINMYYEEAARTVTYYKIPFPKEFFAGFIIFGILVYIIGKNRFMKKEV